MPHNPELKRVNLETAAKTLSRFSPPELIYPETNQIADNNFGNLSLKDHEEARLKDGAEKYRAQLQVIRDQLTHRALLCIAIDQTGRRESGLYVDTASIRFGKKPESTDPYDLSITNWEFSPDGHLSRGRIVRPSAVPEFGAWDIRYIKDASISNAIRQSNGEYSFETLTIDDVDPMAGSAILGYSSEHHGDGPFYDAFANVPGENV